ncbi:hypothetical protein PZB74_09920 [Porifericola rhodea]|uniref:hypothetical protein n=1 Tax=Porifericola rhodea TaxID=930972 RepID=UPI0026651762|nr:hypothetical protein [Porifericola rhodea]WKN33640.1 hypothetical protein PZB74_09920 [Porifericola rhodea]
MDNKHKILIIISIQINSAKTKLSQKWFKNKKGSPVDLPCKKANGITMHILCIVQQQI